MGSFAYGVSNDLSDTDVYGFVIPPKEYIFPANVIKGFGFQGKTFDQYQQHHMMYKEREYDVSIYNITKYFELCMQCNPNMIDSMFVRREHIIHSTAIAEMVRENRHLFLSKLAYPKFKGYSYSQLHKIKTKKPQPDSKRYESYQRLLYDCKYAYHVIRLLDEAEQIFATGDIDLQRNKEELKAIRRGEFQLGDFEKLAESREKRLEKVFADSKIREKPDEQKIRSLLLKCLEHHYGSLDKFYRDETEVERQLEKIRKIINE